MYLVKLRNSESNYYGIILHSISAEIDNIKYHLIEPIKLSSNFPIYKFRIDKLFREELGLSYINIYMISYSKRFKEFTNIYLDIVNSFKI